MDSPIACNGCDEPRLRSDFHADRSKATGHTTICKACVSARQKAARELEGEAGRERRRAYFREYARRTSAGRKLKYRAMRAEGIRRYGSRCACCGETHSEFLTFDHVGEWGDEHRANDTLATTIVLWLHRNDYPQDGRFQLLCWNCNCARGTYGYCPHERAA